jgi:NAD-dependent deacetylase
MQSIEGLTHRLRDARRLVALTGAGVSTESGIPDFRSGDGLWDRVDPMKVASAGGFAEDPLRFYRFWCDKLEALSQAEPNPTHRTLASLEAAGRLHAVVTQNIDGLHQKAGSKRVYEVHGTFERAHCLGCGAPYGMDHVFDKVRRGAEPSCDHCGDVIKPDVVLFGDMLPPAFEVAVTEVDRSDLLLVLGSSLEVHPVAALVPRALRAGTPVCVVNREPGPYDAEADLAIHGELGAIMDDVGRRLRDDGL